MSTKGVGGGYVVQGHGKRPTIAPKLQKSPQEKNYNPGYIDLPLPTLGT